MSEFTFATRRIVGDRPDWVGERTVAFVAPRPLWGTPRQITPTGWAGEVSIELDEDRAADMLDNNLRMDATVVEWIPAAVLVAQTRERLAGEYGADAVADVSDDEILSMAASAKPAPTTITVGAS